MDLHPDGVHVATAHHDNHVRITRLTAKVEASRLSKHSVAGTV